MGEQAKKLRFCIMGTIMPAGAPRTFRELHLSVIQLSQSNAMIRKMKAERGVVMKLHMTAMVLTGLGLLSACSIAGIPESGSRETSAPQTTEKTEPAAETTEVSSEPAETYSLPNLNSFTAKTLDGGSFTAADFADADVTAINIWSTTCGPCIREMPELAEFAGSLPENLRIMTWCIDAEYSPDAGQISDFLSECGFTGVTLTSGDGDLSGLLNELMYTPTTVFVDSAGNLLCEPVIGAGDIETNYTAAFNEGLQKLGKDPI